MSKDETRFTIDQLRKDKIIYALESIATTIIVLLIILVLGALGFDLSSYIPVVAIFGLCSVGYWLYAMVGNYYRLQKIRQLEKNLSE